MQNQPVQEFFSTLFQPSGHDVDYNKRLRLTSFMQKTQEAAEAHATLYGCGYDDLIKQNIVWVLSRMQIVITRMPEWGEPLRLDTWHKRVERIFALRDFILYDASETPVIKATCAWLLMDIHSRRMLRIEHFLPHLAKVNIAHDAIREIPDKLNVPDENRLTLDQNHIVGYSDLDLNNHVNNTKYVEWALDLVLLEDDNPGLHTMTFFQINFNMEARKGDWVDLWFDPGTGLGWSTQYIEGRRNGQSLFQAICKFE